MQLSHGALRIVVSKASFPTGSVISELEDGSCVFCSFFLSADGMCDVGETPRKPWEGASIDRDGQSLLINIVTDSLRMTFVGTHTP